MIDTLLEDVEQVTHNRIHLASLTCPIDEAKMVFFTLVASLVQESMVLRETGNHVFPVINNNSSMHSLALRPLMLSGSLSVHLLHKYAFICVYYSLLAQREE